MAFCVMDASAAVAGLSPDEDASRCAELVERALVEPAAAPPLRPYEIGNILALKFQRTLISQDSLDLALASVRELRMELHGLDPNQDAFKKVLALASKYRLTVYDASYLELAQRLNSPLATLDQALLSAARGAGVSIL